MAKYRFICLLNHSYKLLSTLLLRRTTEEVAAYLPDTQAGCGPDKRGFRKKKQSSNRAIEQSMARGFQVQEILCL